MRPNMSPISSKSRQDSVALSTSEAEYMTSLCGQEIAYNCPQETVHIVYKKFIFFTQRLSPISCPQRLRAILRDLGVPQSEPTLVYEDNLACIAVSINPVRRK